MVCEILAPYVKDNGKFYAAVIDPKSIDRPFFGKLLGENLLKRFLTSLIKLKLLNMTITTQGLVKNKSRLCINF